MSPRMLRNRKPYDRPRPNTRASDGAWLHDKASPPEPVISPAAGIRKSTTLNNRLVISGLHYNVSEKDLTAIFGQIGTLIREPVIKYDRSGRSMGIAFVHYERPGDAVMAKRRFHGVLAKGEPMTIDFDAVRPGKRPTGVAMSLADRISKPPLIDRLAPSNAASDVSIQATKDTEKVREVSGPIRTRVKHAGVRPRRSKEGPKTAEDLDKELDAFMNTDAYGDTDVEMAA